MKKVILTVIALAVMLPVSLQAQRRTSGCCSGNRFSFAPYVGAYKDAYDLEADGSDLGWMIGFKAGYQATDRLRAQANLAYAEANDVGTRVLAGPVFDNEWILLSAGAEFALVPGITSVSLGGEAGVAWRRTSVQDGDELGSDGWASYDLLVPALTLRHQFSSRAGLFVTGQDLITDILENNAAHSPALTVGLSFR